jgi:hypothetical protein
MDEFPPRTFRNDSGLMASLMGLSAKNAHTDYGLNGALQAGHTYRIGFDFSTATPKN